MTLSHLIGLTSWEQGCGQAFLGDSLRSPRPSDLLACQFASRREDHGQVSIIMSVLFYAIRPCNDLDTIVANGRKQTVLHLFLDAALKTVAYLCAGSAGNGERPLFVRHSFRPSGGGFPRHRGLSIRWYQVSLSAACQVCFQGKMLVHQLGYYLVPSL